MKTSNKILLVAFAILLTSLVFYDLKLKGEYVKGGYKNPYENFITLNFRDFNSIKLNASTAANVMLVKGPFKVMADPEALTMLKLNQHKATLTIDVDFKYYYQNMRSNYVLYISCPNLRSFEADAYYTAHKKKVTDTIAGEDFKWKPTIISGFESDSLYIRENHASNIVLKDNSIKLLNVVLGADNGSASNLTIEANNQFDKTNFDIKNKSRLWLKKTGKIQLNYHLADSAKLIMNGAAQDIFKSSEP